MKEYSKEIVEVVKEFLKNDNWKYTFDETYGVFDFGLRLGGKLQSIRYVVRVREKDVIIYGVIPFGVEPANESMVREMNDFICMVNYGLKNGCFEFDRSDGEVRYKCFIDCEHQIPYPDTIKNSVAVIASMMKYYSVGIIDIIFLNSSAKEAVKKCEGSLESLLSEMGKGSDLKD